MLRIAINNNNTQNKHKPNMKAKFLAPAIVAALRALLVANGWTWVTAVCTILFSLFHWPCSTTCLTVWKETGSVKWTLLAIALPTALGTALCLAVTTLARLTGLA